MHKSFDTLRNKYNMKHYYCYAHIIRSFGASSPISVFVREILYSNTQEQFERNLRQSTKKFNILLSLKSESTTPKNKKKFEDLCIKKDPNQKTKIESDLRYSCLYQRILDKVPTTTNHAESFHSKVNDSLPARGKYAQYKGIGTVIETMQRSIFNANVNLTRQTNEEMKKIKKEIIKKNLLLESRQTCNCSKKLRNQSKFKIDFFPCIHTITSEQYQKKPYDLSDFHIDELPFYTAISEKAAEIDWGSDEEFHIVDDDDEEGGPIESPDDIDLSVLQDTTAQMIATTYLALKATIKKPEPEESEVYNFFSIFLRYHDKVKIDPSLGKTIDLPKDFNEKDEEDINCLALVLAVKEIYKGDRKKF